MEGIERGSGRTEVLVTEGLTTVSYALDEALVAFDTALKEKVSPHPRCSSQYIFPVGVVSWS